MILGADDAYKISSYCATSWYRLPTRPTIRTTVTTQTQPVFAKLQYVVGLQVEI